MLFGISCSFHACGTSGGKIVRKGGRGRRWELLTPRGELKPSGQLSTSSASLSAIPLSRAEDAVSPMTQTFFSPLLPELFEDSYRQAWAVL